MLDAFDRVIQGWSRDRSFGRAIAETVARTGYASADVERQLHHVTLRCLGRTMRILLEVEIPDFAHKNGIPSNVLTLASSRVPGLVIEGIAAAAALDADALVRPSRDETVLHHLLGFINEAAPDLARRIKIVGADQQIPWTQIQSAMVFGTDSTIAMVHDQLPSLAAQRVAAYGSRQAISVVMPGAEVDPSWSTRLADDVLTFRQSGCMCPAWLFLVGQDDAQLASLQMEVGRELIAASERHLASGIDVRMLQRRVSDADILGAIAAGLAPNSCDLYAADARLAVINVPDLSALVEQVRMLGSLQQTAVIASDHDVRANVASRLLDETGITRVCLPGQAHEPDPLWPQDGIGRIAPLVSD